MADLATSEKADVVAVPFHGEQILTVEVDGQPHVVLKPALERIGVDYAAQYTKLKSRSWAVVGRCPTTGADGKTYEMVTVDVQTFLMLLATIDENRVGHDVKPKLVLYQAEVAKAIEDYWTKGKSVNPRAVEPVSLAELALMHAQALVNQEREIKAIRSDVTELGARVDGIEQHSGWYTALGFARIHSLPADLPNLQGLGRRAAAIAKRKGIKPGRVHNEMYGWVGSYPEDCLMEAAGLVAA